MMIINATSMLQIAPASNHVLNKTYSSNKKPLETPFGNNDSGHYDFETNGGAVQLPEGRLQQWLFVRRYVGHYVGLQRGLLKSIALLTTPQIDNKLREMGGVLALITTFVNQGHLKHIQILPDSGLKLPSREDERQQVEDFINRAHQAIGFENVLILPNGTTDTSPRDNLLQDLRQEAIRQFDEASKALTIKSTILSANDFKIQCSRLRVAVAKMEIINQPKYTFDSRTGYGGRRYT